MENRLESAEHQSGWMDRLLIAMDESLRLGLEADELSKVLSQDLAPADFERFESARRCVQLLNELFRSSVVVERSTNPNSEPTPTNFRDTVQPFQGTARYHVVRWLGSGAMGAVYEVFDTQRNTNIALKRLLKTDASRILRFKQEFRRLANVFHKNVCTLFELAEDENVWFITMERIDGTNFIEAIKQRGIQTEIAASASGSPPAIEKLCDLFLQLATGLHELHLAGILHRDLKPANVLVTPTDRVVVIDFGLATSFNWRQLQGMPVHEIAGTFAYMAPEQIANQNLLPSCDWYSFGVMLFQALTGSLPVGGPLPFVAKQYIQPPDLLQYLPSISMRWNDLCQSLLAREPSDRPTGHEVIRASQELQNASSDLSRQPINILPSGVAFHAFIGREHELQQLRTSFQSVLRGQPTVVPIQGTSGIGKTTLVDCFLEEISREHSPVILRGRCHERDSLPFKTLDSLVDSLCKYLNGLPAAEQTNLLPRNMGLLGRMFPVLGSLANSQDWNSESAGENADSLLLRRSAFEALRELLFAIARTVPLVIFIDDLQWGDTPGAAVLSDLLNAECAEQLMLILAFREEHITENSCIEALKLDRVASHSQAPPATRFAKSAIKLGPLTSIESAHMAENVLALFNATASNSKQRLEGVAIEQLRDHIASEAGGMPFYLQELARHATDLHADKLTTASKRIYDKISLNEVLRRRIATLASQSIQLISMIAIAGRPIAIELVCQAIDQPSIDDRNIHELCINRWLRSDRDGHQHSVTIFHDRVRESIIAGLTGEDRTELHARLAFTLERAGAATSEQLAHHFDAGQQLTHAARYYKLAGIDSQRVFAFEKAAEHYRRAVELASSDAEVFELTRALGEACSQAGRGGEAASAFLRAADLAPTTSAEALELRMSAARQYCISGYTDEGRILLRSVLASNGIRFRQHIVPLIISFLFQRLRLRLQGLKFTQRSETQVPSDILQRVDLMWDAVSGLSFQEPVVVGSLHTQCLRAALKAGEPKRLARALALESILSATSGTTTKPRVERLLSLAHQLTPAGPDNDSLGMLRLATGGTAFLQVRMPDAVVPLAEAERIFASQIPKAWWELTTARSLLSWAYMHMGDFRSLQRCIDIYKQDAEERGDRFLLSSINGAGIPQLHLVADRPDLAQVCLDELQRNIEYKQIQQYHVSMLYSQSQIDLYIGDGPRSWQRLADNWSKLRKSLQLQNQFARVSLLDLRSRSATLAFSQTGNRRMLKHAHRDLRPLKREAGTWVQPFIDRLQAGIYSAQERLPEALAQLRLASDGFERIGFRSSAAITLRRLGQLLGDEQGKLLIEQADQQLRHRSVQNLDAFARAHS